MFNLIEYSHNFLKLPGSLFHYYNDEPAFNKDGAF